MKLKLIYLLLTAAPLWVCGLQRVASAQLATPSKPSGPASTLIHPTTPATAVEQNSNQFNITGGQASGGAAPNVIHQFDRFDVRNGDQANFIVAPNVSNVVSLIDSPQPSSIYGTLQIQSNVPNVASNANLILVNPEGLVFGESIQLNLSGDLTATTASGLLFSDTYHLDIDGVVSRAIIPGQDNTGNTNPSVANLTGPPTGYVFTDSDRSLPITNPLSTALPVGSIHNKGTLALEPQSTLTLLGRYVQNDGDIVASGGTANLVAVTGDNLVRLSQPNNILALELISTDAIALQSAAGIPQTITGGDASQANRIQSNTNGSQSLTSNSSLTTAPGSVLVRGSIDVSDRNGQGTVNITAEQINVIGSEISANGINQGGFVSIGTESGIITEDVMVNRSSAVSANASAGQGGTIKIRAADTIRLYGDATANGTSPGNLDLKAGQTLDVR
ncbi:two-partner secretion domain-containing protein [Leptothoe kymatousa]|uniref:Filamentous hemagglutinin N-terminal domain-containing protein n=1 Tax=Leptothoe kymatousa TAU-MAC 1615 TaxID=2364775 RepID=A0ABS5Y5J4_9CYAN|nr:filamentous hemagglutinin N-terminal domain-containing protein [Leptothoe kymatousa]MBT9313113.1 filamentous hemagglutinin N-terminal domain-containing protein [Leptothoe kymatousa TAU-MAC 1615]